MSPLCVQKLARLQAIVAERVGWAEQLKQVRRMRQWLLDTEHVLDGSWAQPGEVVSNQTVGRRLDCWRQASACQLTVGTLSELEQACLHEFVQVLTNLRPHLVQCYDRQDFPRTTNELERSIRGRKHAVWPCEWAQELEQLSVALRALCCLRRLVGARCGPSTATGAMRHSVGSRSLAPSTTRGSSRSERATQTLSLSPQASAVPRFP